MIKDLIENFEALQKESLPQAANQHAQALPKARENLQEPNVPSAPTTVVSGTNTIIDWVAPAAKLEECSVCFKVCSILKSGKKRQCQSCFDEL
jgi:hypothetical protein